MVSIFSTRATKIGQNISLNDKGVQKFEIALKKVCLNLAKQIVVDGEGAKKFVTINVINAKSLGSAKNIAFSIANSPLIKTAIAGEDPNWGRIIASIGSIESSNIKPNSIKLMINNILCFKNGISLDNGSKTLEKSMRKNRIEIVVDLNNGKHKQTLYFCDLSHDYVRINSEYTT